MNLTTLLGLNDLPGYLAGHGWIDADLARDIAADGTWRKVLTLSDSDREALLDALCGEVGHGKGVGAPGSGGVSDEVWLSGRRIETLTHGTILGIGRALTAAGITPSAIRERSRRRREQLTYRPSQRLAEIVRARDGVCRFPGCTVRAVSCDIDHTVPFDHTTLLRAAGRSSRTWRASVIGTTA
ncbi:HNH endonuclease signature motif containing protein [Rhodococcus sp. NPDC003318]|uniref:HNH endonuclease signature motif containing protein n=1 Tax=Rhodococcus sp. NPDC003318 TaxID=3364503 RepID=UPI0036A2B490